MVDKHNFIANFSTEKYKIYCDEKEAGSITSGVWANLDDIFSAARKKVEIGLKTDRAITTGYVNVKNNKIMFWSHKVDEWWTL